MTSTFGAHALLSHLTNKTNNILKCLFFVDNVAWDNSLLEREGKGKAAHGPNWPTLTELIPDSVA